MIECKLGERCKFSGNPADLIAEFTQIVKGFDDLLTDKVGGGNAKEIVAVCGKAAYSKSPEEKQAYGEMIASILAGSLKE